MADRPSAPLGGLPAPPAAPRLTLAGRVLDRFEPPLGPLEDDYRRHYLPTDLAQVLLANAIAIGVLLFFAYIDYRFFGWGAAFIQLLLLRLALVGFALIMYRRLARATEPRQADRLILLSELITGAAAIIVNLSRPATYWQSPMMDLLIVITFYALIPQPLVYRLLAGVGFTLASAAVLLFTKVGIPPLTLLIILVSLLLGNVLGLLVSTRLFNYRRDQYKALVDQKAAQATLEWLATTDSLTGILNRRRFMAVAEQELARYHRHGHVFTFLLIDLDRFKNINDTYGHQAGDQVLCRFTDLVRRVGRSVDSFGRLGGEEFGLLLPETDLAAGRLAAERLRTECQHVSLAADAGQLPVTFSAGLVQVTPADASFDSLMRRADQALYRAKQAGRNRVEVAA